MDVLGFRDQYEAGRETLGLQMPVKPPAILNYVYRASPLCKGRGGGNGILKYVYGASPLVGKPGGSSAEVFEYVYRTGTLLVFRGGVSGGIGQILQFQSKFPGGALVPSRGLTSHRGL